MVTAAPLRAARCTGIGSEHSHVALVALAVLRIEAVSNVMREDLLGGACSLAGGGRSESAG
jgi:hypothetical protein